MDLWETPAVDVRPMLTDERRLLIELLQGLSDGEWRTGTEVPGWAVKDLALHLLDDDLGWLSRGRDGDPSGVLRTDDAASLVQALADKNQRWAEGARGLSLPVVVGLLTWSGRQMDAWYSSQHLQGAGRVSWASDGPAPLWFDIAQDLTGWVHQMQVREALGRIEDFRDTFLPVVLGTFVWALPHQYAAPAPAGTTVQVDLGAGGTWHLGRDAGRWVLHRGPATRPAALVRCSDDGGWRWLTGARVPTGAMTCDGPPELWQPLLGVRGILA